MPTTTQAALLSTTVDLGLPDEGRLGQAESALLRVAHGWHLPAGRTARCLAGARTVLDGPHPLTMHVQLDRVTQILSIELWSQESVLFSRDDWAGC